MLKVILFIGLVVVVLMFGIMLYGCILVGAAADQKLAELHMTLDEIESIGRR